DVTFTYDRLGRSKTVADGLGSRTFAYNAALQPLSETISGLYSATITRNYAASGVVGRPTGLTTGALYTQTYGYDTKGRYNFTGWTVNALSGSATYTYVSNSDLIGTLTTLAGQSTTYSYEANRNLRTQINNQFNSTLISQYDYLYDQLGRRTSVKNSGTAFSAAAFNRFVYNDRSELNESGRYLGTDINILTSPVTAEYRSFLYDPIGNRTNITVAANNGTYSANNLNQYSTESVAGGGSNSFTYDDDGNLTAISGNKNVQYVFNAENQVITMQPTTPALNNKKLDFVYDYQGRRVQKIVSNWAGVAWVTESTKRFVYDGWNVIEEQTVAGTSKYYVWGLDLSQSLQGAGGIGGLLTQVDVGAVKSYAFLYDGNGNVGQLIDNSDGSIDAHYEYDSYGGTILSSGTAAAGNPYRFSTKYLDSEYNLYYYGYRYYDPSTGRWVNRDPIGELGGININIFVENSSVNLVDPLGLQVVLPLPPQITIPVVGVYCSLYPDQCLEAGEVLGDLINQGIDNLQGNLGLLGTTASLLIEQSINKSRLKGEIQKFWKEFKKSCKRIYPVSKSLTPSIYQHTLKAFALGKPPVLTYAGDGVRGADARRRFARRSAGVIGSAGIVNNVVMQWDEYPYASTLEGGFGASVMAVPAWENRGVQGPTLQFFFSLTKIKAGEKFTVVPIP
ncbi:MAG: hypothetical protein CV087_11260, partial [Candidatus Brocadia sp. WS118]